MWIFKGLSFGGYRRDLTAGECKLCELEFDVRKRAIDLLLHVGLWPSFCAGL